MRSLRDLYESTDEVHLVCLLADAKNISFEHGSAKDDGNSREVVETVGNEVMRSRCGEILIAETRKLKKDEQPNNRELQ